MQLTTSTPGDGNTVRWIALAIVAVISGGEAYYFYAHDQVQDIIGVLFMAALVSFFYAGDAHVDEVIASDAKKAERE